MRFDYLILAHDGFAQLERLVARLLRDDPKDRVVLHVDAKASLPTNFAASLSTADRQRIVWAQRVPVRWAHWSQCRAMLALLDAAASGEADHLHLLSGRDWPLVPRATIARDIARAAGRDCFIEIGGEEAAHRMQRFRFGDRWLGDAIAGHPLGWRLQAASRQLSRLFSDRFERSGRERSRPLGAWAKGSQWWSLPHDAALHARGALRTVIDSGRLRFTECSDEHVVPTALLRSRFAGRIAPSRRFTIWTPPSSRPETLRRGDLANADGAWFARKFDAATDDFFYAL